MNNLGLNKLQQKAKDTHRKIRIEVCRGKRRGKSHATNGDIEALVTRRVLKNQFQGKSQAQLTQAVSVLVRKQMKK